MVNRPNKLTPVPASSKTAHYVLLDEASNDFAETGKLLQNLVLGELEAIALGHHQIPATGQCCAGDFRFWYFLGRASAAQCEGLKHGRWCAAFDCCP